MKIAIMGFRGIPARYGGFETFVEKLAPRLVEKGHQVTVYCRSNIIKEFKTGDFYKGVKLVVLPTISHKYFDTVVHTFFSSVHSVFCDFDVILFLNAANAIFTIIPKLAGIKTALNVDGIERMRKKWNWAGKFVYRAGEFLATILPDAIVSDAEVIRKYYLNKYNKDSVMIPYGADVEKIQTREILDEFGLVPKDYVLYVSRLEPENNAHTVIQAFKQIKTDKKLVIAGDAPYSDKYKTYLRELAQGDKRIIFTGFVFGNGYRELQSHAYCYVQATEVGGTHPALIEAMGAGNCVIANDTPENKEVLGGCGFLYKKNDVNDLKLKLEYVLGNSAEAEKLGRLAKERIAVNYAWDSVTDAYIRLFEGLMVVSLNS